MYSSFFGSSDRNRNELERSAGFHLEDAVNLGRTDEGPILSSTSSGVAVHASSALQFGGLNTNVSSSEITSPVATGMESGGHPIRRETVSIAGALSSGQFENWGDSGKADASPRTRTSTDVDTDEKNQGILVRGAQNVNPGSLDSMDSSHDKRGDQKTRRRLAQNREAARKSRLRKKAHVQQLESSRLKLGQLKQELQQARQQGIFIASGLTGNQNQSVGGNELEVMQERISISCLAADEFQPPFLGRVLAFDMEYARWLDEHQRQINGLRSAVNSHVGDAELCLLVNAVMAQYNEIFRLKSVATKSDVFHILSGMWKTPAERCFMWLGGFRSSELLKLLANQLGPLTDQQLMGICNLQQSCQQAEDALSQGMEVLQQSLSETLSAGSLSTAGTCDVANYMGQMAAAIGQLGALENFIRQADLLRQQTLQQMLRSLTTRQAAWTLLAISDYFSRLRALSSLWLPRPKD